MSGIAVVKPQQEQGRARQWLGAFAVALLALLVWWPLSPYWQSDDFLAITYAMEPRHALHDFVGNQYAAPGLVWFYRPLITLSFAVDAWIGGADPFVAHLSNALAHAISTFVLALLGRRLLGAGPGVCLALLWAVWPTHAGSIVWAVGRVDSHTTLWILLAWLLTVRWLDRGRGLWLALLAFALALLSKELAFVVPAGAMLLGYATTGTATQRQRLARGWRAGRPFLLLFAVYLVWRVVVLGRLVGGYQDAPLSPMGALAGFGLWLARVANPMLAVETLPLGVRVLGFFVWPIALACAWRRQRLCTVLMLALGLTLCALPTAPFWSATAEVRSVRYFYLPATCLLGVIAVGGWVPTLLALLCAVWPLIDVRQHYHDAHQEAARLHDRLRAADRSLPPGPLLVRGLPRQNAARDVLQFHLFIDRLLLPPFGTGRRVLALRPLVERLGVLTLPESACASLTGVLVRRVDADGLHALPPFPLPTLSVQPEGDLHLSSLAMWDLHLGRAQQLLHIRADRSLHYRLTVFTGGGYLACVLPNETPNQADGTIALKNLIALGRYASEGDDAALAIGLGVPTAFDVSTEFPLLVEAGDMTDADPHRFVPRARANRFLFLRFDRDYNDWLAGKVDDPRKDR